ncbi:ETS homologous factor isoform X1 [Polypterus senegalus]
MWQETHPQFWTKFQVWEWLQHTFDIHQMDAMYIPFQNFDIDGGQLCMMTFQDFNRMAGHAGPLLYHSLMELMWSGTGHSVNGPLVSGNNKTQIQELPGHLSFKEESCFYDCTNTELFNCKEPFQATEDHNSPPPASQEEKKQHIRGQGTTIKKHSPRGTHLWEFIRDILLNPDRNPGLIKWEDRTEGVFRFLKSEAVAQLWGKKKNNSSMTYEKLSRAMRYYYKREILERVDGRRLVYKFGRNARGWRECEK